MEAVMAAMPIPAYCSTCGVVFPSAFSIENSSNVSYDNCSSTCPNGHQGTVLNGTYSTLRDTLRLVSSDPATIAVLRAIAERALQGKQPPEEALAEMFDILPGLATIIKKLGTNSPLVRIALLLVALGYCANQLVGFKEAFFDGPNPVPPIIINNNNTTVINGGAAANNSDHTVSEPIKKEQVRRMKQAKKQKGKRQKEKRHQLEHK
jgi:hypothetical protein